MFSSISCWFCVFTHSYFASTLCLITPVFFLSPHSQSFFHFSSSGLGFWWQMEPRWHHSGKDDWDWQAYWGHTGPVQHQPHMLSHTRLVLLPKLTYTFEHNVCRVITVDCSPFLWGFFFPHFFRGNILLRACSSVGCEEKNGNKIFEN